MRSAWDSSELSVVRNKYTMRVIFLLSFQFTFNTCRRPEAHVTGHSCFRWLCSQRWTRRDQPHTHVADEIDTDRNGMIDPQEFRAYLEKTILEADSQGVRLDMPMVLQTAFRGSLRRVRHERGVICRAFCRASEARKVCWLLCMFHFLLLCMPAQNAATDRWQARML